MTDTPAVGFYRALLRLYPRPFRNDYGRDMVLLFAAQLRDESPGRVWVRGLVDLAITVPAQHLEAHVNRPPNPTIPAVFLATGIAGIVLAVLGGSNLAVAGIGLAITAVAGVLTYASWQRARAVAVARPASEHWWKLVAGGALVFLTTIVIVNVTGEVPEGWWWPMMGTLLAAIAVAVAGAVLGIARLAGHRPAPAA